MSFDLSEARTWSFAGGEWQAGADGGMAPVDAFNANTECGMQACRFAIATDTSYRDFRATFHVRHDTAHSDVGLIFRARNRCDFTVLHFPCCGQGYRAQHFWTALSRMDASGYLRIDQLSHGQPGRLQHPDLARRRGGGARRRAARPDRRPRRVRAPGTARRGRLPGAVHLRSRQRPRGPHRRRASTRRALGRRGRAARQLVLSRRPRHARRLAEAAHPAARGQRRAGAHLQREPAGPRGHHQPPDDPLRRRRQDLERT